MSAAAESEYQVTRIRYAASPEKLYLYSDLTGIRIGWFADAAAFLKEYPSAKRALRVAAGADGDSESIEAPPGYHKTGSLAHHPAVRIPTVRDFVSALSPGGAR